MTPRLALLAAFAAASPVAAQTLLSTPPPPEVVDSRGNPEINAELHAYSLTVVEAPKPKTFEQHDLVTIVISETSQQSSTQKLDAKKTTTFKADVKKFPDLMKFLEAQLVNGDSAVGLDLSSGQQVKGDGKYQRDDRFVDRITAEIIDVKPNGRLTLEARRTIQKDEEVQMLVLVGECRREDVTEHNTILSSQLASLTLRVENEGHVKDAANKGWITRVFQAVFNF